MQERQQLLQLEVTDLQRQRNEMAARVEEMTSEQVRKGGHKSVGQCGGDDAEMTALGGRRNWLRNRCGMCGTGVECVHNRATTVNQKVVEPCFPCLLSPWASLCH